MLPELMVCQALLIHLAMPPLGRSPRGFTPLPQPGGNLDLWAATVRKPAAPSQASCGPTAPREEREGAKRMRREKRRGDHPEVFAPGRADYTLAMDAASSEESRVIALNALQKDFYAASARAPQQSLLSTWLKMHEAWFRGRAPPFPLSMVKLEAVSALMKAGGYSSFRNYLSAAKSYHIKAGNLWTPQLDKCARDCVRSVLRGLGPAKRSDPLEFEKAASVLQRWPWNTDDDSRPVDSKAMVLTAVLFMMREIEVSSALLHEFSVLDDGSSCQILLPVSKKDSCGRGTVRTLECMCDLGSICLPHYMAAYMRRLSALAFDLGKDSDDMPLFPNHKGQVLSKPQIVAVVRRVVLEYMPAASASVLSRYGGHTFRITGARWLSGLGLDPCTIAVHGRWTSSAIMTYLAEAPLESLTKRLKSSSSSLDSSGTPRWKSEAVPDRLRTAACFEDQLQDSEREPEGEVEDAVSVLNTLSKKIHRDNPASRSLQHHDWSTKCGWKWAGKSHVFTRDDASSNLSADWSFCPKCWKHLKPETHDPSSSSESTSNAG